MSGRKDFLTFLVIAILALAACRREAPVTSIELPPVPVAQERNQFAVISSSHLRLRKTPSADAELVATFWNRRQLILEVLSFSSQEETISNETSVWYFVQADGISGWVFGANIELCRTREDAERRARELP